VEAHDLGATSQLALPESLEATAFLKSVLGSSRDCIKVLTLAGDLVHMNDAARWLRRSMTLKPIRGCAWTEF